MKKKRAPASLQKFKAALKQIASVPKSEVNRVLAEERQQKQQQRKRKA